MENIVEVLRGGRVESRHVIHAAATDGRGNLIASLGDPDFATYFRSSAKPFQTLTLFRSGVIDHFDFSEREVAVITASHSGEEFHVQLVRKILQRIGASEADLQCGFHPPLDPGAAQKFFAEHRMPSPIYNNCSGKHAGMLAACKMHGYELKTYTEPEHPHQVKIRETIAEFAGLSPEEIGIAKDGCGVPVFYLTLRQMARMYSLLAASSDPDIVRLRNAMMHYPECIAGTGRFDTVFMRLMGGRAISKTGAEGVQSVAFISPRPVGVALKAEDGGRRGVESATVAFLLQLGLISKKEAEALSKFWKPDILDHSGKKAGQIRPKIRMEQVAPG